MFNLFKRIFKRGEPTAEFTQEQVASLIESALVAGNEDCTRHNRLVALEKALTLYFSDTGPTTDDPIKVARAAATFERFLDTGEVAAGSHVMEVKH